MSVVRDRRANQPHWHVNISRGGGPERVYTHHDAVEEPLPDYQPRPAGFILPDPPATPPPADDPAPDDDPWRTWDGDQA